MEINHSSANDDGYYLEYNEWMCMDTLLHTFQFLDFSSLINSCSLVSRQFNRVAKSNTLWRMLYEEKWLWPIVKENYWEFGEYEHYNFINLHKLKDKSDNDEDEEENDGWDKDWNEHKDPFYWFRRCMQILECLPRLDPEVSDADIGTFHYQLEKRDATSETHLKLATILAILFRDYSFSFLRDHVVIALRDYLTEGEQEIICPLVTFCMMILDSSLMNFLPIRETEGKHLCVAQFLESEPNSGWMNFIDTKDCCFFNLMEGYYQRNTRGELTFSHGSDDGDRGFSWCPKFFNAGGIYYTYEIRACSTGPCSIKVEKSESSEYY